MSDYNTLDTAVGDNKTNYVTKFSAMLRRHSASCKTINKKSGIVERTRRVLSVNLKAIL